MLDHEALAEAVILGGDETQVPSCAPNRQHGEPARLGERHHLLASLAVHVDHGSSPLRQQLCEQAELLVEIGLEARVVVEMVARDVGEGAGGKPHAVDAALLEPMARRFERKMGNARLGEIGKDAVQLDRIRRGVGEDLRA